VYCCCAPSLDILGGQSRQCARLREGLKSEASLQVDFYPHNPRMPRSLRWLQRIKYVRTIVTTWLYVSWLLACAWRYDILHVFSALLLFVIYCRWRLPFSLAGSTGKKSFSITAAVKQKIIWRIGKLSAIPTMRLADTIVVPSGYLVEVFSKFGLKARPIHNIVELERFQYRERKPLRRCF
jgi:glycosyltransferase involved in cell wall biosynthesis